MNRSIATWCMVSCFALWACDKKEPAPTEPAATPAVTHAPVAVAPTAPSAEPVVDVASLPVNEQYEAEAEKEITTDNLSAKLDDLEKEITTP